MASTLCVLNPLRYRGYVYDTESGLYYLQSRYYTPELCRFINADDVSMLGADGSLFSLNLFAYCDNNPVVGYDPDGAWDLGTFISGVSLLATAAAAIAVAAPILACASAGALITTIAATTMAAGTLTAINGAAEITESVTGYNVVRDGFMGGDAAAYEAYRDRTAAIAKTGTAICGAYTAAHGGNVCFVAGTIVLSETGSIAIESVRQGDLVWAWDEETGDVELKEVVETYINETDELVHVFVNGEEIITTPSHPFYSPVKDWTDAVRLRAGDILVLVNGEYVVVEWVQHEILESPVKVYNFQVSDYHTYYVANSGVLVHNSCNHKSEWNKERKSYWRETSKTVEPGADYGSFTATTENINRMSRGLAPIGWDGYSVQLHHWQSIAVDFYDYSPVSRTLHQIIHSIT